MAELQTSETVEPSTQEQAAIDNTDAMAQAWEDNQAQLQAQLGENEETAQSERPEWLPDKFESPEAMAKAYSELEGKLGADLEPTEETEGETSESFNAIERATDEFMESGELSDETFTTLEQAGLPRQLVESYIAGQQAIAETQTAQVYEVAGGQQEYQAMAEWAAETLDEGSLDAFNQIVEAGSIDQAKVAVQGLYSQYRSATGGAPPLVQGQTTGQAVLPFASASMVSQAMSDPRYKIDPDYRESINRRLAVSDVL